MGTIFDVIQLRRGTAAEWASVNPILADGEEGLETDTGYRKVGDGITRWNALQYFPLTNSSEWIVPAVSGLAYLSSTQLQVSGDQSSLFPVGRRLKVICAGGTYYGSVSAVMATGTPLLTIIGVTWDGDAMTGSLSSVSVGILSPVNHSIPIQFFLQTGMIVLYPGSDAPAGTLQCDGSAVSRVTYANLFTVCDILFGPGDGVNTFNLPDITSDVEGLIYIIKV